MKWQGGRTSGDGYRELKLYQEPATLRIASQCSCNATKSVHGDSRSGNEGALNLISSKRCPPSSERRYETCTCYLPCTSAALATLTCMLHMNASSRAGFCATPAASGLSSGTRPRPNASSALLSTCQASVRTTELPADEGSARGLDASDSVLTTLLMCRTSDARTRLKS